MTIEAGSKKEGDWARAHVANAREVTVGWIQTDGYGKYALHMKLANGWYHYSYFTGKETEALAGQVTFPESQSH